MWGGDLITAAVSHLAASTRPESLLMTLFMNDWTDGHVAGYRPRLVKPRFCLRALAGHRDRHVFLGEPLSRRRPSRREEQASLGGWAISGDVEL